MMCGDVGQNQSDTHDRRSKDIDTLEKEDCQAQDLTKNTMVGYFSMSLNLKYKKGYNCINFLNQS